MSKVKEPIYIAIGAWTTHLDEPRIRQHMRSALASGATKEEIMDVSELTSAIGAHTCLSVCLSCLKNSSVRLPGPRRSAARSRGARTWPNRLRQRLCSRWP
ncbi:MAG TPA: hypothetical protein VHC18_16385 [Amycolatopsis sp.]|nr:hypothetical protein [Amycolatopsis sp.]